jgi:hypothetical protein
MLSRIFWVGIAGIALVIGMVLQDGSRIFSMAAESESMDGVERSIEASVDRAIDGSLDGMQVMDGDGNEIDVPPETKRALGEAVGYANVHRTLPGHPTRRLKRVALRLGLTSTG